jgi:hypothetical protein
MIRQNIVIIGVIAKFLQRNELDAKWKSSGEVPELLSDLYIQYSGLNGTNVQLDLVLFQRVRSVWDLTSVFWAENAERICKCNKRQGERRPAAAEFCEIEEGYLRTRLLGSRKGLLVRGPLLSVGEEVMAMVCGPAVE